MDCAAEEQMVRDALDSADEIRALSFDLQARRLVIHHVGTVASIAGRLSGLGLGATLEGSEPVAGNVPAGDRLERRTLLILLCINATMFFAEQVAGWIASSVGLLADSLDMLADASVYGIALYVVGRDSRLRDRVDCVLRGAADSAPALENDESEVT
jgi:hypothetical protein